MPSQKSKKTRVAVHDGTFHPDESFAVATLSLYLKKPLNIIRSRDPKVLATAKYVFDVGRTYDPKKLKFDHHQDTFHKKRKNGVPYATAGLVWKHFGRKVAGSYGVFDKIDRKIIQPVDAEDNGIELYKNTFEEISPYTFGDYIHALNPTWKEENVSLQDFKDAVEEAKKVLIREMKRADDLLHSQRIITAIYKRAKDKRIIVLDHHYSGWKRVLGKFKEPLFVIKPVPENKTWHSTAMNVEGFKFKNRLDFPKSWAGLDGKELQKITGVPDALFCHNKRFIVAAKSREGAIALSRLAISQKSNK